MTQRSGEWLQGLVAAGGALSVRDGELGDADLTMIGVVGDAHRLAADSIRAIETIQADMDGIGDAPDGARRLLERHRDLIGTVRAARDAASAKAVALQRLREHYTG